MTDKNKNRHLESEDWGDLAKALAPHILALIDGAIDGYEPPFDIHITDGNANLIFSALIDEDGKLLSLIEDKLLNARYPLTIKLSETGGITWEATIESPDVQGGVSRGDREK